MKLVSTPLSKTSTRLTAVIRFVLTVAALILPASAHAQHRLCDPGGEDCRALLINHIRAETVGLDVAFWFMEDHWMASEVIARWQAGVPVRILMDTEANSPNPLNAQRLAEFAAAGIPMRERTTSGILHWKMMLFASQNLVEFSGANYSSDAWLPQTAKPFENYVDEVIDFTTETTIVNSFKTKYDDLWTNTTQYTNYRNITGPLTRRYATYPIDPRLNFVPDQSHFTRASQAYQQEPTAIDVTMYRITDWRFTDQMIQAKTRGIQVRLLTEPQQYRDVRRLWHSYNIDLLYMNGIQIRNRTHAGLNHQKSVLLKGLHTAIYGSSNWSEPSAEYQEEHNLFTQDPATYQWLVDQFERKWNNTGGVQEYGPFAPLPPDQAFTPSPATGATSVPVNNVMLIWDAGPWAHKYDVYIGTSPGGMTRILNDEYLGPSQWVGDFKSVAVPTSLQPGTTYYWRVDSRTIANMTTPGQLWSFTTAGAAPPPSSATVVRQPYLQQVTSTAATVVWATREAGTAQVRLTLPGGATTTTTAVSTLVPATATGLATDYYQHVARLQSLSPATTYQYDILLNAGDLNPGIDTIRTAPATGSGSVSFVAFGDSGTGSTQQQQIANMLAGENFDFAMHGGDLAYGDSTGVGGATYQTMDNWFFGMYAGWLRSRPMFPSIGNHDSRVSNGDGRPYLDLFVLPEHGSNPTYPDHAERYYSFDYGPVHVVVLDTELAFQDPARRAAQLSWLEADLTATTQPWKVALFHRSPYSAGGEHGSDLTVRDAFGPVFDRFGVQLVISAHEHDYERTVPMRAGVPASGGTTYIVSGGGGAPLYPAATGTWTAFSASVHHYLRGTATTCTLRVTAVSISGGALDDVELTRCAPPAPVPAPWTSRDIGAVGPAGSASESGGTFTVRGAGADVWNSADAFHYVSQPVSGDVDIVARVTSVEFIANWVKAGVMVRQALTPDSAHAFMIVSAGKGIAFQRRVATGGLSTSTDGGAGVAPNWVKLERRGNTIRGYRSPDGVTWTLVGSDTFSMGASVQVGLAVSSHDATRLATVTFDNVSVTPLSGPANTPPSVALTSPTTGATFTAPATIGLAASASDSDGTVTRVDFYNGTTLLGTDMTSPYAFSWTNVPAGTYSLTARATDDDGSVTTSSPVSITVNSTPNTPPSVALTSPAGGATFTAPATIGLAASASDSDGTVTRVDFFNGTTLLGTDLTSPYAFSWTNVPAGTYSLTARATDDDGAVRTSAAVAITVNPAPNPNAPPSVALTSPTSGATFTAPATIGLAASASDSDGTVARVDFYNGTTLLGSDTTSPYAFSWSNVSAGTYSLTARATDDDGAVTASSAVSVTVNPSTPPPTGLPSPWQSQDIGAVGVAGSATASSGTFTVRGAGADIWNGADAFHYVWQPFTGDSTVIARVTSVEFVANWVKAGVMIRETLTDDSPHALMLVSAGKGLAFQRRVARGGISTNTSGGAGVAPAWVKLERRGNTITAYRSADGVSWTLVDTDTFTMPASVYVGLAVSSHDATRTATVTFDNVSVAGGGTPPPPPPPNTPPNVSLTNPSPGATFTAPASMVLRANASDTDGTVTRVEFYNGPTLLGSDTSSPYEVNWTDVSAGSYTLTARAIDDDGAATTSAGVTITVNPPTPPPSGLPAPWQSQDIGSVGAQGSATSAGGTFTVRGAGGDIWGPTDAFHFAWQPITGNVDIVARVTSIEAVHVWVKGAVMIREALTPQSAHAMMLVSSAKGLAFQRRTNSGGSSTNTSGGTGVAPAWVKLERRGNTITAYRSADGVSWTLVGSDTFAMPANVYVGLAVTSHDTSRLATVTFDNVTVTPR